MYGEFFSNLKTIRNNIILNDSVNLHFLFKYANSVTQFYRNREKLFSLFKPFSLVNVLSVWTSSALKKNLIIFYFWVTMVTTNEPNQTCILVCWLRRIIFTIFHCVFTVYFYVYRLVCTKSIITLLLRTIFAQN